MIEHTLTLIEAGLQVVPAMWPEKRPIGKWSYLRTTLQTPADVRQRFNQCPGLSAIDFVTGSVSGGLEVVDVDCKYDLTGRLFTDLWQLIRANLPGLINALVVVKTVSGGYHLYYRCEIIEGNQKLAQRETTPAERLDNPKETVKVLIETRGEGGFIVAPPTPGYKVLRGDLTEIPTIKPSARKLLLTLARSLNDLPAPVAIPSAKPVFAVSADELTPWEDYNLRGDIIGLLKQHGWVEVGSQGERIHLKRPRQSKALTSGNFHQAKRKLIVFSSSTPFEPERGYSPFDAYKVLEGIADNGEAAKRLRALGYGYIATPRLNWFDSIRTAVDRVGLQGAIVTPKAGGVAVSIPSGTIDQQQLTGLLNIANGANLGLNLTPFGSWLLAELRPL